MLNSAGNVNPKYTPPTEDPSSSPSVPPKLLVDAASQGLFLFLRTSVARTLTRLYPVAPGNADEWLGQEILRAAGDPGALGVFRYHWNPLSHPGSSFTSGILFHACYAQHTCVLLKLYLHCTQYVRKWGGHSCPADSCSGGICSVAVVLQLGVCIADLGMMH